MPARLRCRNIKFKLKRWQILSAAVIIVLAGVLMKTYQPIVKATGCPDLRVIFVRGSGGERYTSGDYLAFKEAMETKLATTELSYTIDDLDYPAVSIDINDGHLGTLIGAYISGGDAYDFGESVHEGTDKLVELIKNDECKNTKYVLAGYSQGTMVVMNGLDEIDADRVIYVATFGDPKIYLPEGAGAVPVACANRNLSEYRIYVPDCRAYKGILGERNPYVTSKFSGKVGTWCNKYDILCSSHYSIKSHTSYETDGLYEDASRYIFSKIGKEFNIRNQYTSPHDTVILIDSTDSMDDLIDKYKAEAMRLAEKTLKAGGRVALYDYRDLVEGYVPVERCNFQTCNLETFRRGFNEIVTDGGGDEPESLMSSSLRVMRQLNWNLGSTKSLVILTDAGYHSLDLDGTTFYDVQKLSKQIDPVNFYIITEDYNVENYRDLAQATGGVVVASTDDLSLLTDTIMERFDSLPRVEEEFVDENYDNILPTLVVEEASETADGNAKIRFSSDGRATVLVLNGAILGTTYEKEITITGLNAEVDNKLVLVPLSETRRGEGVEVDLNGLGREGLMGEGFGGEVRSEIVNEAGVNRTVVNGMVLPKAPNTGRGGE